MTLKRFAESSLRLLSKKLPSAIKICLLILPIWLNSSNILSQELTWKTGLSSFFDNTEFGGSSVIVPQTMAGVVFSPEIGLKWDTSYRFNGGITAIHEFGSEKAIDYYYPTAYFSFDVKSYRFLMGAFPRNNVLEKYPRIFFQDSVSYYRPNINGIFWEIKDQKNYFNLWLDWTSRQSMTRHEAFFIGFSGRYNKGILFAQHFGYMYHFAGTMDPDVEEPLHDNILLLTSIGLDLSGLSGLTILEADAGWSSGIERSRADQTGWIKLNGLLIEAKAEYRGIGLFNTFYKGEGIHYFYNDHGNDLYWGDPVYRAKSYNRSDLYIRFIRRSRIDLRLIYSLHFLESEIYHEQALKLSLNLNNF